MLGDNWCVSCLRVILAPHQFHRSWCDACIDAIKERIEAEAKRRENDVRCERKLA